MIHPWSKLVVNKPQHPPIVVLYYYLLCQRWYPAHCMELDSYVIPWVANHTEEKSGMMILSRVCGDYIRRVLDWQLDLLDTQLHTITVYTLYNFEVHYNTCRVFLLCLLKIPAPTAATNSYGIPCHHPLSDNYLLELSDHGCRRPSYIAREQITKKTPSPIPLLLYDVITGTDPKENNSSFHCCVA
jgi:hypothetical protein